MACTATASRSVKQEVIVSLEMSGCVQVTASLDRPNIYYEVNPRTDIDTDFRPLVDSLKERVVHTPRVLVYCQSLGMCAELYAHFHQSYKRLHITLGILNASVITACLACFIQAHASTTRISSSRAYTLLME